MNNYLILSTDSIIPWILLPNKCSFLFFAIHLLPVEEGEFLLYIMLKLLEILYLRCLQVFSDNLQSCHFPVYHSINSYIFLSKFSNFLVITSLENRLSKNLIIRLFLILFSIILSYYASFAILFISSFASINPRCVYTFNVTPISECPIKYWSAFGFIPAFAILEQYVCLHT